MRLHRADQRVYVRLYNAVHPICLEQQIMIGGWGGEYVVAPTGKSFRFVRACERAGARAARDQLTVT